MAHLGGVTNDTRRHKVAESEVDSAKPTYPEIIVAVFHVDTETEPIEFHWAFFVQFPGKDYGLKVHATDISDFWQYDTWPFTLSTSESVAAAVVIGQIPEDRTLADFEAILKTIPMNKIPEAEAERENRFDCRVWLREGIRRLHQERWIRCRDVYALEDEIQMRGEDACQEINNGTFTHLKIHRSRFSV